jgi:hypothetical protein
MKPTDFSVHVTSFLTHYLAAQRNSRKHLTAVANPLDTIDVSSPESIKLSRKLQKR